MSNTGSPRPGSEREEALFAAALQRPVSERAAFLDGACHGDAALRARLDALLAANDQPDELLGDNAVSPAAPTMKIEFVEEMTDEVIGQKIGRYKLLERVGEGGCGVVYVAEQTEPVRRRVALKVIKLGMDTKAVVARFEAERQALAMMDHPNIAKVLDAGSTEKGRPFFVMELVRGIRITDYCDQNNLPTQERLDLFIKVCQAIQHAHQKGIIHRDIKPSNILVTLHDGVPVPKVIDFGIAKATEGRLTDATVYTQLHQFIGTPAYMSPEQAEMSGLDIDTRSDIYSLGVLLYELLAGSTPFDAKELVALGIDAMRKTIREKEPVRPSTRLATLKGEELTTTAKRRSSEAPKLIHLLKGDLDWIVMKALEKDRTHRYETANGLAADLQRHLSNEPVVARPPSTAYRLQKLMRRNKLAFAAGTAIAASLVIGIAASVWQAVRAERESTRAKSAEQRALTALDELRASAPVAAEQARAMAAKEQFDDAIMKLDYAIKVRPDAAEYLVAKADLLQCQLKFVQAAAVYREALRVKPGLARAEASAKLCDELLAAPTNADGKLTRESLAKLYLFIQKQQRPAAELKPVARQLARLWSKALREAAIKNVKNLPDGTLEVDLSGSKFSDLTILKGAPISKLNLNYTAVADLAPLRGMALKTLHVDDTEVNDLGPLQGMPIEHLEIKDTKVADLSALRGMPIGYLQAGGTKVTDLEPLRGMPLTRLWIYDTKVTDLRPLAGMPLQFLHLSGTKVKDLSAVRGMQMTFLRMHGCSELTDLSPLADCKVLNNVTLPPNAGNIEFLRTLPNLTNLSFNEDKKNWVRTDKTAAKFWQEYDAKKKAGNQQP